MKMPEKIDNQLFAPWAGRRETMLIAPGTLGEKAGIGIAH